MSDPFPRGVHPCASGPILSPVEADEIDLVEIEEEEKPAPPPLEIPPAFSSTQAFPSFPAWDVEGQRYSLTNDGMSLLDYFAGQCIASIGGEQTPEEAAEFAYRQAAALMVVRNRILKKGGA